MLFWPVVNMILLLATPGYRRFETAIRRTEMARTDTHKKPTVAGFFSWDEMDEECLRQGAALKRAFHTTAVRGTPRRKARVAGGPKNRARRKTWIAN